MDTVAEPARPRKQTAAKEHKDHAMNPELQKLIEAEWAAQDPVYKEIAKKGVQEYLNARPDKQKAFMTPEQMGKGRCRCCSDEGNRRVVDNDGKKILLSRTPGSGILDALDREDKDPFGAASLTAVAQDALKEGVTIFTGHRGCGAAKAVYEARIAYLESKGMTDAAETLRKEKVDEFAERYAKAVAARMREIGVQKNFPGAEQIASDFIRELDRPETLHRARCVYVTDDDTFDAGYTGLPQGFVECTGGKPLTKVFKEVDILRGIGFSADHGFGMKFSEKPEDQFLIICIANTTERLEELTTQAKQQIAKLPYAVRGKVRVDGLLRQLA